MLQIIPANAQDVCNVSGTVKDMNGSPIVGAIVLFIDYDTNVVIACGVTDIEGAYTVKISLSVCFKLKVSAVGYVQMQTFMGEGFGPGTFTATYDFILREDPGE